MLDKSNMIPLICRIGTVFDFPYCIPLKDRCAFSILKLEVWATRIISRENGVSSFAWIIGSFRIELHGDCVIVSQDREIVFIKVFVDQISCGGIKVGCLSVSTSLRIFDCATD